MGPLMDELSLSLLDSPPLPSSWLSLLLPFCFFVLSRRPGLESLASEFVRDFFLAVALSLLFPRFRVFDRLSLSTFFLRFFTVPLGASEESETSLSKPSDFAALSPLSFFPM